MPSPVATHSGAYQQDRSHEWCNCKKESQNVYDDESAWTDITTGLRGQEHQYLSHQKKAVLHVAGAHVKETMHVHASCKDESVRIIKYV